MGNEAEQGTGVHVAAPHWMIVAAFVAFAFLTSFLTKALDANDILGIVPLGGLVGVALLEVLWCARRKA